MTETSAIKRAKQDFAEQAGLNALEQNIASAAVDFAFAADPLRLRLGHEAVKAILRYEVESIKFKRGKR